MSSRSKKTRITWEDILRIEKQREWELFPEWWFEEEADEYPSVIREEHLHVMAALEIVIEGLASDKLYTGDWIQFQYAEMLREERVWLPHHERALYDRG